MLRLFVAIDVPNEFKEQLKNLCQFGIQSVRWVNPDQFHLSLRFIGEVQHEKAEDIKATLSKIKADGFTLSFKGVGTFPAGKSPRVIWAGVPKNEPLNSLQKKVETQLSRIGITKEKRKFSPHLTLGRVKTNKTNKTNKTDKIADYLAMNSLFETDSFEVSSFYLFSSQLTPKGAIYTKLEEYILL